MREKSKTCTFATLAVVFVSRTASAQSIDAPRLVSSIDATYPAGAHGDAVAVLDVVVGRDGAVTDVHVYAAAVPFIDGAIEAARRLTFEPARRDGVATIARVRVEIPFVEPREQTPVAPSSCDRSRSG